MKLKFPLLTYARSKCPFIRPTKPDTKESTTLPEFVYAGKNLKPHTRIYVMGTSTHGALGVKRFLKPPKGKVVYKYMQRPHRLTFAETFKVEDIACGYGFTVMAMSGKQNDTFFGTGVATNAQIGVHGVRGMNNLEMVIEPRPINLPIQNTARVKKIACGRAHTMVWTDTDGLWTFGNNSYGQCGRPVMPDEDYGAKALYHHVSLFTDRPIDQIECGQDTSFVLTDGKVYSCGWSSDGQTGRDTFDTLDSFGLVEGDLKEEKVVKISSKADCVLALTEKGDLFGWGNSEYRQLGTVTDEQQMNTPKRLKLNIPGKIVDVAAAGTCCFVVTDDGLVWSWGYGILGRGPDSPNDLEPKLIPSTLLGRNILNPDAKVTKIFAGSSMAAAVTNNGGLFTWGRNVGGCLGLGHTNFQHFPMRVCVASEVIKVSCGVDHMAVLAKSLL